MLIQPSGHRTLRFPPGEADKATVGLHPFIQEECRLGMGEKLTQQQASMAENDSFRVKAKWGQRVEKA